MTKAQALPSQKGRLTKGTQNIWLEQMNAQDAGGRGRRGIRIALLEGSYHRGLPERGDVRNEPQWMRTYLTSR